MIETGEAKAFQNFNDALKSDLLFITGKILFLALQKAHAVFTGG